MIKPRRISIRPAVALMPLCMSLLATAMVVQNANALRYGSTVDDEVVDPVMHWIHPAAVLTLIAGYGISIFVLVSSMKKRSPKL